jgi:hypothetical protein
MSECHTQAEMLSTMSIDGLGLPRLLCHLDSGRELGMRGWNSMLRLPASFVGLPTCREDPPPLSQYLPNRGGGTHERK